jgi:hypothetical protein
MQLIALSADCSLPFARHLLVVPAAALFAVSLAACGSTPSERSAARVTAVHDDSSTMSGKPWTHKNDRDNDNDNNNDDAGIVGFGHAAGPADRRISVTLVTRYFAAAARGNGAEGCSLLVPTIAEAVPEDDGHSPGLEGKTCSVVMSKLFKRNHQSLVGKHTTLKVVDVRVEGSRGLAILEFPTIPETRQITERRVGNTWKLVDLLDSLIE